MCPGPQERKRPNFQIETSRKGRRLKSFQTLKPLSTEGGAPGEGTKRFQSPPGSSIEQAGVGGGVRFES